MVFQELFLENSQIRVIYLEFVNLHDKNLMAQDPKNVLPSSFPGEGYSQIVGTANGKKRKLGFSYVGLLPLAWSKHIPVE